MGEGRRDALAPLLARGRMKIYCPGPTSQHIWQGRHRWRMAHHRRERFVITTLLPWIRRDVRDPYARPIVTGCSVGAMYSSIHPQVPGALPARSASPANCRASSFFEGKVNETCNFSDPLAFLPGLKGAALESRFAARRTSRLVVGQETMPRAAASGDARSRALLHKKRIPNHVAFWGEDSGPHVSVVAKQAEALPPADVF